MAGLLLFWALAWLALPPLLKSQLESRLTGQLGRQVTLGRIDIQPWSLELTLEDFALAHADAADPAAQLSIQRIYVNVAAQSLWRLAPVVDAIVVEAPRLRLKHLGQGRYDIDDVVARLGQTPASADAQPLQFALYNLSLVQGEVSFDDAAAGQQHQLRDLSLKLPFLSNQDVAREVTVQPQLSFVLNGSQFGSSANSRPFAQTRQTQAQFSLKDMDLAPYLVYWPVSLPLRPTSAVLNADLKLSFEQTPQTAVVLSGVVTVSQVKLVATQPKGSPAPQLLAFESLRIELKDVRPLARKVQLGRIDWAKPTIVVQRNAGGEFNWQTLFQDAEGSKNATKNIAKNDDEIKAAGQKTQNSSGWTAALDEFALLQGQVRWRDDSTPIPAQMLVTELDVSAQMLQWPLAHSVPFSAAARVDAAMLAVTGQISAQSGSGTVKLTDAPLTLAEPYLAQRLVPRLTGQLNLELGLNWQAARSGQEPAQLTLEVPSLRLDRLELSPAVAKLNPLQSRAPLASLGQLQLEHAVIDLTRQTASVKRLRLVQPKTRLKRQSDGRWMYQDWLKATPAPLASSTQRPALAVPERAVRPWSVAVQDLALSKGSIGFADASLAKPVAFDLSAVSLTLTRFDSRHTQAFGWSFGASMRHGETEPGQLSGRGSAALSPLVLQADLTAHRLPLHALQPYLAGVLNIELLRADASFAGRVNLVQQSGGTQVLVQGDAKLEDLRADSRPRSFQPAEELLSWKDLSLTGLNLALTPGLAPQVAVAQTTLSDFYARLTLNEAGRLNLQEIGAGESASASAPVVNPAVGAQSLHGVAQLPAMVASGETMVDAVEDPKIIAAGALESGAATQNGAQSMAPVVSIGPISLMNGRVDFTDRFIKPNYSARLTELTGRLGAFATQTEGTPVQLAAVELRGRAEGTATLDISGTVNPLAKPLALDIKGHVRDLELAPLSTYAMRYAGYGIERGKLSVNVEYKVQPDGQLTAGNNIVLNQLKFGDQVPGSGTNLPVKLAVALLADRNGVIDIDLPVSGSLNDPQFRLGPIVFKLIVNLVVKAVTAPFSLLAKALGGGSGDEFSMVAFAPGSSELTPESRAALDQVGKALLERPALKMTVIGTASLEVEREAFKQSQLEALVLQEKRRAQPSVSQPLAVTADEYPGLLKAVYRRADFPKPRNVVGLARDLPVPEMQALLLANLSASDSAMQELAVKRGVAVRDYLAGLKLPLERLFLGAAKAVPPQAKWRPRAELNLTLE